MRKTLFSLLALAVAGFAQTNLPSPYEHLGRLDALPKFRPFTKVGAFTSYDRTGGNDDGFDGTYSFIRKEGDSLVIAELEGPGVLWRIWTPTPTDDPIDFYFDGEAKPRLQIKFSDLFSGAQPPFLKPLVGAGAGGFFSYVPMPFAKGCKVVFRGPRLRFYQINYALYESGARVTTYPPSDADLKAARALLGADPRDLRRFHAADPARLRRVERQHSLEPGKSVSLFESKQGGRIAGIRIWPASAFAGAGRDLVLRAWWDGEAKPAIEAPVSDLFGYSFGDPASASLLAGTADDVNYMWFPMPFEKSARIELVSDRSSGAPVAFRSEVIAAAEGRRPDEGKFYAVWRRENPTRVGEPFTFIETTGRGHLVGVTLQAQGLEPGGTPFFEGDDQATIDGELTIHGTGSEDFFNGGWYDVAGRWADRVTFPLSGCLDYKKHIGRTAAYRLFLSDAYAYRKSLKLTIEHAPTKNSLLTDYTGVTFLYSDRPVSAGDLPPAAARAISDPVKAVFTPGNNEPVYAFSRENVSLTRAGDQVDGRRVRVLSVKATGGDYFGPPFVAFWLDLPKSGTYSISIQAVGGPGQGFVQLLENDRPVGEKADLSAQSKALLTKRLGALRFRPGLNTVFLQLLPRDASSPNASLDLIRIECERQPE